MALPFLRGAAGRYAVAVVCRPPVAAFLRAAGIEAIEAPGGWLGRAGLARDLKLGPEDATVCVWADTRAQILMRLTGAGTRVGFPMTFTNYYPADVPWGARRLRMGRILAGVAGGFGPLLTHALHRASRAQHHMEDWAQIADALGLVPDFRVPWIASDSRPPAGAEDFFTRMAGTSTLLVHPGGRLPEKRWPRFAELLEHLSHWKDIAVVILEPPGETAPRPAGKNQCVVRAGDWPEVFALFQAVDAVVCNDSLASHLAAAFGKPVVTLFGSGSPDWFAPWGNRPLVVTPPGRRLFPFIDQGAPSGAVHLGAITVEQVESRLRAALNAG